MRDIVLLVLCAVVGAIVTSWVMAATLPHDALGDPTSPHYRHATMNMMYILCTIPLGSWLGGLTGYAVYISRNDGREAARLCIVQGLWVAIPLAAWGLISAKLQAAAGSSTGLALLGGGQQHWVHDFVSQCGLSLLWSLALIAWGIATLLRRSQASC